MPAEKLEQESRFLLLPIEIRLLIYEYVLAPDRKEYLQNVGDYRDPPLFFVNGRLVRFPICVSMNDIGRRPLWDSWYNESQVSYKPRIILRPMINRQIYAEIRQLLYKKKILFSEGTISPCQGHVHADELSSLLPSSLKRQSAETLRSITNLGLTAKTVDQEFSGSLTAAAKESMLWISDNLPNLRSVHVFFSTAFSKVDQATHAQLAKALAFLPGHLMIALHGTGRGNRRMRNCMRDFLKYKGCEFVEGCFIKIVSDQSCERYFEGLNARRASVPANRDGHKSPGRRHTTERSVPRTTDSQHILPEASHVVTRMIYRLWKWTLRYIRKILKKV
ncbi:uncharacterized protein KY384_001118 [Bacidia gigantensis]|uniref:uncharacterized protein n=1 Tax=Bacidia gigantensis TaxID=2732470 RepID=UPI001D038848|nr:uncharacterized protein KY384_001118 [Bacidia gigantensis]KAG8534274.1 hypothetical protein KY384_001118 [Bacidia gigantensis]